MSDCPQAAGPRAALTEEEAGLSDLCRGGPGLGLHAGAGSCVGPGPPVGAECAGHRARRRGVSPSRVCSPRASGSGISHLPALGLGLWKEVEVRQRLLPLPLPARLLTLRPRR